MNGTDPTYSITLDKNSYVAFDATSIRDLIISRLNQGQVFTDQNYQGSNLSALIDVIGYSFSTLLFYLNKTASESMFSESSIYENMNRIVKILNYNPVGRLGQNVPFTTTATFALSAGNYTIPRFSYVNVGGTIFSIGQNVPFTKYTNDTEIVTRDANTYLIYQGFFQEYQQYTAFGIDNEILFMSLNNTYIDHLNVYVFVKPAATGIWEEWTRATDLFLYGSSDNVFELRFNQNKNYEIKFGDDINGKKLNTGDIVQVFYLNIDPNVQPIGQNGLNDSSFVFYNSVDYLSIMNDLYPSTNFLTTNQLNFVTVNNDYPATSYKDEESIDNIRSNAPKNFRSQYRLVTYSDYAAYINSNYSSLITDLSIVNNDDYLSGHMKYLYDIGLTQPQTDNRILINQINFASSCNFNNLYLYMVPNNSLQDYLTSTQKEFIINGVKPHKGLTTQIVPMDPVYVYMDFYIESPYITPNPSDLGNTKLVITKDPNTRRANSAILSDIENIFSNTFDRTINKLGQVIDIFQLTTNILNLEGVQRVQTYRSDLDTYVEGISLLLWDGNYPDKASKVYTQNLTLEYFMYPVFNNLSNLNSRITILEPTGSVKAADF